MNNSALLKDNDHIVCGQIKEILTVARAKAYPRRNQSVNVRRLIHIQDNGCFANPQTTVFLPANSSYWLSINNYF